MKKNIAMRVAAFLFILTMISTCAFATTFAKYTTSGTATDTARVAKFGVTVTGEGESLFAESYNEKGPVTVKATEDVLAPGTNGSLAKFTITGTPEVSVKVIYTATLTLENWTVNSEEYCPIEITVNGETYKEATVAALKQKVEQAISEQTKTYSVEEYTTTPIADVLQVSWKWAFEGNDNDKDTALGEAATAKITLSVTCTVEQVD